MSADIDLDKMDKRELEKLRADVETALNTLEARRFREAKEAVTAVAKEHGYKLEELVTSAGSNGKSKLPPKYQNPDDKTQTWSGRGRKPKWFNEAIESGVSETDLEV